MVPIFRSPKILSLKIRFSRTFAMTSYGIEQMTVIFNSCSFLTKTAGLLVSAERRVLVLRNKMDKQLGEL